jgi:uncharacterized coiled-coil protein SlyX
MLDVHPPHHSPNTWRDFLLHIATIVVGLLIAIGLEQTVEAVHHRHQRHQLQEQILEVMDTDLTLNASDIENIQTFRAYLTEQLAAVTARRAGKSSPAAPPPNDPRVKMVPFLPSLAAYEAAKENGTVAVLPSSEIRLFNRVALQRQFLLADVANWHTALTAWESFEERFVDSKGDAGFGHIILSPSLDQLSPAELAEYQTLIATLIKQTDLVDERFRHFDAECRSILTGTRDENKLFNNLETGNPFATHPAAHP